MLRLLLVLILVFYVLHKLGIFRLFFYHARQGYNEKDGGIHIHQTKTTRSKPTEKAGEYIDFEEVD
ncbi:MAG: hypothetical protein KatS3mg032_0973 [Cyclobacteriaceae bacterium]|nr:MAG: hypothetical protein KatS3mg032_0973 [Cyclobacteriaceae bacterium]